MRTDVGKKYASVQACFFLHPRSQPFVSTASISSVFRVLRNFSRGAWNTAKSQGLYTRSWRDLYQAAIHEPDMDKLSERVADAESALVIRMRGLFYNSGGSEFEEEESIEATP